MKYVTFYKCFLSSNKHMQRSKFGWPAERAVVHVCAIEWDSFPFPLLRETSPHRREHSYHFSAEMRVCDSISLDAIIVWPDDEIILLHE